MEIKITRARRKTLSLRILPDGINLAAVADDAGVLHQKIQVRVGKLRTAPRVKAAKRAFKRGLLSQHCAPGKAGLKALEAELGKQCGVAFAWAAIDRVVILDEQGVVRPGTAGNIVIVWHSFLRKMRQARS